MSNLDSILDKVPERVRKEYLSKQNEIAFFRKLGQELREELRQNPTRNGHLLTREMHKAEYEVVRAMCPAINDHEPKDRLKAWQWVLKQDWAKDLRASPYEQRYF